MNHIYYLEGPVTTRVIVINADGRVATRLYVGESVAGGEPWAQISRARAAVLLNHAMHSPAIVIGRELRRARQVCATGPASCRPDAFVGTSREALGIAS